MTLLNFRRLTAGATAITFAVALSACGSNASDAVAQSDAMQSASAVAEAMQSEPAMDAAEEEIHPVLLEAVNQSKNLKLSDLPGGDVFEMFDVHAEAPATLVYEYTYKAGLELTAAEIEESVTTNKEQLEQVRNILTANGIEDAKVIYRYFSNDGTLIYEVII